MSVGAVMRILKTNNFQFSADAQLRYVTGNRLRPLEMIQKDEMGDVIIDRSRLLTNVNQLNIEPSLAVAFAPSPHFGVQSSLTFNYGILDIDGTVSTISTLSYGVGINFDANKLLLPIAIPLAYQIQVPIQGENQTSHRIESGLFYSGRPNVSFGINVWAALKSNEYVFVGQFSMFYYW
jgi:hypothetical protein